MHQALFCPRLGGGGGLQPRGNWTFLGFQMPIFPPLDLHYESNSRPWGELIGIHNTLLHHSASSESNFLVTNGTHKLCAFPQL